MTTQPTTTCAEDAPRGCAAGPSTCPATPATTPPGSPGTSPSTSAPPRSPTRPTPPRSSRSCGPPPRPACGSRRRAPVTTRGRCGPARARRPAAHLRDARRRRRRRRRHRPGRCRRAVARRGRGGGRRTGWPRCTARPPTSASSATRSAAAWAGTPASSACRPTASPRVEIVTADGALVRADAEHEPELFWALRGGGGNFGVVTALEFRLYPIDDGLRRDAGLGLQATPTGSCARWAALGASTHRTRSPRRSGSCSCRRSRRSRSPSAAASWR